MVLPDWLVAQQWLTGGTGSTVLVNGPNIGPGWTGLGRVGLDTCRLYMHLQRTAHGGLVALVHGPLAGSMMDQIHLSSLRFMVDQAHGTAGKAALHLAAAARRQRSTARWGSAGLLRPPRVSSRSGGGRAFWLAVTGYGDDGDGGNGGAMARTTKAKKGLLSTQFWSRCVARLAPVTISHGEVRSAAEGAAELRWGVGEDELGPRGI